MIDACVVESARLRMLARRELCGDLAVIGARAVNSCTFAVI